MALSPRLLAPLGLLAAVVGTPVVAVPVAPEAAEAPPNPELSLDALLNIKVVTASKQAEGVRDAPAVISVVPREQIEREGDLSVAEALESQAGLDLLTDHVQNNLGVRGINGGLLAGSDIVKVMIANQPVSFRSSTENFLGEELIPTAAIERIEVVRGPASALYGANAFMGVVNVIPKKGKDVSGAIVAPRFGVLEGHPWTGLSLVGGYGDKTTDVLVTVGGSRENRSGLRPQDVPDQTARYGGGEKSSNDVAAPKSAYLSASHKTSVGTFTVDGSYEELDSFGEFQDSSVLTNKNHIQLDNYYLRAAWEKEVSKALTARLSLTGDGGGPGKDEHLDVGEKDFYYTRRVGYRGVDAVAEIDVKPATWWNLRLGYDGSWEDQRLLTYETHFYDGQPSTPLGTPLGTKLFRNQGYYLQGRVRPLTAAGIKSLKDLQLTAGIRRDDQNIYGSEINYRVGLVEPIGDNNFVKLLYGTSYKAPAAMQLFMAQPLAVGGSVGNPDLKPEHARSTDFVVGVRPWTPLSMTTTLFTEDVRDLIAFVHNRQLNQNQLANVAEVKGQGIEEEVIYSKDRLSGYMNLSYQNARQTSNDPQVGARDVPAPAYADKLAKIGVNVRVPEAKLNTHLRLRLVGERPSSEINTRYDDPVGLNPYTLKPYALVDLIFSSIDLKLLGKKPTTLTLKLENLTDERYAYPGFRDFDIPGFGRSFTVILAQQI